MLSFYSHKAVALALSFLYMLIMLKPLIPVVKYTANYGVYSNELCENKDTPELLCNGTCQLSKMLVDMQDTENEPATIPIYEGLEWYVGFSNEGSQLAPATSLSTSHSIFYQARVSTLVLEISTPPPRLA
jgi:hypothetical protein